MAFHMPAVPQGRRTPPARKSNHAKPAVNQAPRHLRGRHGFCKTYENCGLWHVEAKRSCVKPHLICENENVLRDMSEKQARTRLRSPARWSKWLGPAYVFLRPLWIPLLDKFSNGPLCSSKTPQLQWHLGVGSSEN